MTRYKLHLLFIADSHLGFDWPAHPRVQRRRRGPDFLANYRRSLAPALRGEVDLVLHGGDLFYRSRVRAEIIEQALAPLAEIASQGIPVVIVPGNHERSQIPPHLLTAHPHLTIFYQPQTFYFKLKGLSLALAGFPFNRRVGERFADLLAETGYTDVSADIMLLCLHQSLEGAKVGPQGYTFRPGPDVIGANQIPSRFSAVLSGHIHRSQILTRDLKGRQLPFPMIYPGSGERTSFAERFELKHYVKLEIVLDGDRGTQIKPLFVPLPARPMVVLKARWNHGKAADFMERIKAKLEQLDPDSVVRIDLPPDLPADLANSLTAVGLRGMAPATMNVTFGYSRRALNFTEPDLPNERF